MTLDQRGAPDYQKYPECGYASHPVDVVTGRAFTHPVTDLALPGPMPLEFQRMYSSKMAHRDAGLGYGWAHTFGWEIEVRRRSIIVWNEQGIAVDFPMIPVGGETLGPWGWVLRREAWGFAVDAEDGVWHLFSVPEEGGNRWRLSAIEDRNRNRIALTYEDGKLVQVNDTAGRTIRVRSTREGRIAAIEVLNAVSQGTWIPFATYAYDDRGHLLSATDADGFSAHYSYDERHRLTADTDRTGLCFRFIYDDEDRCTEAWGEYQGRKDPSLVDHLPKYLDDGLTRVKGIHHCKLEYFPDGYTEVADSTQVRRFFGNRHGTLDKRVEGGAVTSAKYDADGHLLLRTDPLGATTSFERDRRGRVLRVTDPLGRTTTLERDASGLPIAVIDPAGGVLTIERDRHGNPVQVCDEVGAVTCYTHDARGLLVEEVSPRGDRTRYVYDEQGNLVETVEPSGAVHRFKYDALGRCTAEIDALGAERRYGYSARGDLIVERDPTGNITRNAYDGEEHLLQVIGTKGEVTAFEWGGYHKLCVRRDALGNEVRLGYNLEGELVATIQRQAGSSALIRSARRVASTALIMRPTPWRGSTPGGSRRRRIRRI